MTEQSAATTPTSGRPRPLSPHLQVYRLPLPAIASITHRVTGVGLAAGTLLLAWWLIAAATGPEAFATVQAVAGSPLGLLCLLGWVWAFWYHAMNGVRHLLWDAGYGLELGPVYRGGYLVWGGSIGLTVATAIVAFSVM
ncbi:succinate dehydrogenase, cytochrome b556 subunit [Rhodospirillum centenum]|uniref:Succinate dehydrogenase cytochrome b556 subunit n=1 Tax=Rhodospirillum centenum (strain ATCC 51521 / SW) TaxID=414684 RepID=B6IYA7_RHOCS|nr:succinate dehydrogenase, cytochrome b556 subunit [Rhodospirillum centenum]ACJ01281.1 succinate dehydrogenase, cytochrome b556, putative [Rhodospirillum centenum SW]